MQFRLYQSDIFLNIIDTPFVILDMGSNEIVINKVYPDNSIGEGMLEIP